MNKNSYYAIYDISDNMTRTKVTRILKDAGFTRVQKSAFCGTISNQQLKDLTERLNFVVINERDSLYLILTCSACFGRMTVVGKGFDKEYVSGKKPSAVI